MAKNKIMTTIVNMAGNVDPSVQKAFREVESRLEGMNGKAIAVGASVAAAGAGITVGAVHAGKALINMGDAYNSTMGDLQAKTGVTAAEMEGLSDAVEDVYAERNLGEDMQADAKNRVLLPSRQVPEGTKEGDSIEAFIYKDSQDRLIATTKEPKLQVGQTAVLKVSQVTRIGAFLDWGLEKDLLLPYHEQTLKVREGEDVLVALYIDKSSRLCATMKVYHYLSTRTPYVVGDMVKGRVYEISDRFGVFVAVDDKYSRDFSKRDSGKKWA